MTSPRSRTRRMEPAPAAGTCRGHDKDSAAVNKLGKDSDYRRPRQPISAVSWDDAKAY